jgi:hypothetical protein
MYFLGTDQQHVDPPSPFFGLLSVRMLKTSSAFSSIENKESFHQRMFMPVKPFATARGPFQRERQSNIRCVHAWIDSGGGYFENLL